MLLKCSSAEKRHVTGVPVKGKPVRGTAMKMTMSTSSTMTPRIHRKALRLPSKRHPGKLHAPGKLQLPGKLHSSGKGGQMHQHHHPGKLQNMQSRGKAPQNVETSCDNSNDSGFGYDHIEMSRSRLSSVGSDYGCDAMSPAAAITTSTYVRSLSVEGLSDHQPLAKRFRTDYVQMDSANDDSNDSFMTSEIKRMTIMPTAVPIHRALPRPQVPRRPPIPTGPLMTQHNNISRNGKVKLEILCQPETQHRARYQTEGSRGAVKDRDQHGFPIVQLIGYNKPTVLQVFIGTDMGRVAPHMFYQACRVSGKNSTPCTEVKIAGTLVIQIELDPSKEMKVICDCVGILKERNVDVEHRFPEQTGSRSKKKSTRCRMVFRTVITNDDNTTETLQICSQPIICTQPPGVPEISKMSFNSYPVTGGMELIILGKNFLKNTQVVFEKCRSVNEDEYVTPNREFLQQIHLVCTVPPYYKQDIQEPVKVRVFIVSGKDDQSRKASEPHEFTYIPVNASNRYFAECAPPQSGLSLCGDPSNRLGNRFLPDDIPRPVMLWRSGSDVKPKAELDVSMMPPPAPIMSIGQRRPSASNLILPDPHTPPLTSLKSEILDENSQGSESKFHVNDNSMDGMDLLRHREMAIRKLEVMNENSMGNDNSMDSMSCRRGFMSHNEDSMHGMVPQILARSLQSTGNSTSQLSPQELKEVMDLRVKPSVCDLSQAQPPSLAAINQFVTGSNNLQAHTAQSVENFFHMSKLDQNPSKLVDRLIPSNMSQQLQMQTESLIKTDQLIQSVAAAVFNPLPTANSTEVLFPPAEPTVPSISQIGASLNQLTEMMPHSDHSGNIMQPPGTNLTNHQLLGQSIANNITASIANELINESQNSSSNFRQMIEEIPARTDSTLDSLLNSQSNKDNPLVMDTSTPTTKLDALVNSTVDTHMGSPPQPSSNMSPIVLSSNEDTVMKQSSPNVQSNILSQTSHSSPINQDLINNMHHNLNLSQQVSQDIIMASQPGSNEMMLQSSANQNASPTNQNNSPNHDMLINSQVSPNMMCQSNMSTDNVMLDIHQVTQAMNNNILNAALNVTSQELNVNDMMNNTNLMQRTAQDVHMSTKSPPVAVKNMILNAAAEILTSQQTPITESAMNALMTSANLLSETAPPANQPPMIITQAPSAPQTELQQQTDQQRINDALCQTSQQPILLDQHINNIMTQQMETSIMASNVQQILNATQSRQYNVTTSQTSQSIMNNVSLPNMVDNMVTRMNAENTQASANQILNQELCNAVNQQIQLRQAEQNYLQAVAHSEAVSQGMRNDGNFSTMTDNDLLSYIDPTSFDNVPIGQSELNHNVKY